MNSRESLVKNLSGTLEKLNEKNYLLWVHSFEMFIAAHRKLKHLIASPLMLRMPHTRIGTSMMPQLSPG